MIISPVLVVVLERKGYIFSSTILAYIGYTWMGFIFLFISLGLILDLLKIIDKSINYFFKYNNTIWITNPKPSFIITFSLCTLIVIYGYSEANSIYLKQISIKTSKLPKEIKELRIVQISDLHLGLTVNKRKLEKIAELIKSAHPDILFCTGDMIDADTHNLNELSKIFNGINPKYGKYAITGNHEFYFGIEKAIKFLEDSGFTVLRQQVINVDNFLTIIGIDDPTAKYDVFRTGVYITEKDLLPQVEKNNFIILLKHRPAVENNAIGQFDLQLSGHTHKGQIFPFILFTKLFFPLTSGSLHKISNSYIYVSAGTGTWGPPIRFLARPEVSLIIVNKN